MKQKTTPNTKKRIFAVMTISALALATIAGVANFGAKAGATANSDTVHAEYGEQLKDQTPNSIEDAIWGWTKDVDHTDWVWVDDETDYFGNAGEQTFVAKNADGTMFDAVTFTVRPRKITPGFEFGEKKKAATTTEQVYSATEKADINTYQKKVIVSSNGNGSVASDGDGFFVGQTCTISAIPDEGYHFAGWNDGNKDAERTVTITDGANSYLAVFEENASAN